MVELAIIILLLLNLMVTGAWLVMIDAIIKIAQRIQVIKGDEDDGR